MIRYLKLDKLEDLRKFGDQAADALVRPLSSRVIGEYCTKVQTQGFALLTTDCWDWVLTTFPGVVEPDFTLDAPDRDLRESLDVASDLFRRFGNEIAGALLLAALPDAFAAEKGASVLASRQLGSPGALRRRIRGTAQFLMLVLARNTDDEVRILEEARWKPVVGRCWRTVVALRLYHASIRILAARGRAAAKQKLVAATVKDAKMEEEVNEAIEVAAKAEHDAADARRGSAGDLNSENAAAISAAEAAVVGLIDAADEAEKVADRARKVVEESDPGNHDAVINQEDLLGMLLGFSIGTLDVLERFGIRLSDDEREHYVAAWNHIGRLLGIGSGDFMVDAAFSVCGPGSATPLLPTNCLDAARLFEQIRRSVWPDTEDMNLTALLQSTDDGRRLIVAMLVDLRATMPKFAKDLPQLVMRELVDKRVRDRLALGDGGLLELGYTEFLRFIERSPIGRTYGPGTLTGPPLRAAANFVTRTTMIEYLMRDDDGPPFVIPGLDDWVNVLDSREERPLGAGKPKPVTRTGRRFRYGEAVAAATPGNPQWPGM